MTSGGTSTRWAWLAAALLFGCANHTEEDEKACAGYGCSAGSCQAGPAGPECVCGAYEQALGLSCVLLHVDDGSDDDRSGAHPIEIETAVDGELGPPQRNRVQDVDVYRFDASPGAVYLVEASAAFDLQLGVTDLYRNFLSAQGPDAHLLVSRDEGGIVYVSVQALDPSHLGSYSLRVSVYAPPDDGLTLGPATATVEAAIAPAGDTDVFRLIVEAGRVYNVSCGFEAPLQGYYSVAGASQTPSATGFQFRAVQDELPSYALVVSGLSSSIGRYRCTLERLPNDDVGDLVTEATPLGEAPAVAQGNCDYVGDIDFFSVGAHAGKYLWAHLPGYPAEYAQFHAADGSFLSDQVGGGGWSSPGLLPTQTTYVAVSCLQTGPYTLSLLEYVDAEGDTEATATPVVPGLVQGRLEGIHDVDVFRLDALAHHVYSVPLHGNSPCSLTPTNAGPVGVAQKDYLRMVFGIDADGPIFLVRSSTDSICALTSPFDYSEMLEDTGLIDLVGGSPSDATLASIGVPSQSSFQHSSDSDCFAYDLPATTSYVAEISLSSVRVLAPDGTEITIGQSAPFTTTVAGRYTVCALGPGWSPQSLPALVDFPYTLVVRVP